MTTALITNHQKRKIKDLVDELIINHGILKSKKEDISFNGMDSERLIHQAFKYYRMILKGESPLDIDISPTRQSRATGPNRISQSSRCIGCDQRLSQQDLNLGMPVCVECRRKIRVDFEILRELLQ